VLAGSSFGIYISVGLPFPHIFCISHFPTIANQEKHPLQLYQPSPLNPDAMKFYGNQEDDLPLDQTEEERIKEAQTKMGSRTAFFYGKSSVSLHNTCLD
jgi:hypothetical protein